MVDGASDMQVRAGPSDYDHSSVGYVVCNGTFILMLFSQCLKGSPRQAAVALGGCGGSSLGC